MGSVLYKICRIFLWKSSLICLVLLSKFYNNILVICNVILKKNFVQDFLKIKTYPLSNHIKNIQRSFQKNVPLKISKPECNLKTLPKPFNKPLVFFFFFFFTKKSTKTTCKIFEQTPKRMNKKQQTSCFQNLFDFFCRWETAKPLKTIYKKKFGCFENDEKTGTSPKTFWNWKKNKTCLTVQQNVCLLLVSTTGGGKSQDENFGIKKIVHAVFLSASK